jgi:uroporphyrinogen III methyltransferase / synthase
MGFSRPNGHFSARRRRTVAMHRVYLVGAGPGDPGLLTLRGAECLRRADVIFHEPLPDPALLDHAPAGAERICLGRGDSGEMLPPEEVRRRMIDAARRGLCVVRLRGGDPEVFGRTAEDIEALRAAGIEYEVVPGVTAAAAAAAYAGIPLTHRGHASAVALVAAFRHKDRPVLDLDYAALAAFPGTLVFYMGETTAAEWGPALIRHGKPADTPAAIVCRATLPDQTVLRSTLGALPETLAAARAVPPAVVVVGPVAALAPERAWFARRPLFGRTVLVTRPRIEAHGEAPPADPLAESLAAAGACVLVQPAVVISDPPDWQAVDDALARLDRYDWLVFSSANGVRRFLGRLLAAGGDARRLGRLRLAAIGPGTADALARYRLRADLVPEQFRAESLVASLAGLARGKRFLLVRASRGREVLAEGLRAAGAAAVDQVVAYTSTDVERPEPAVAQRLAAGRIDWVTVTSSAVARSLVRLFGEDLRRAKLASISPVTSQTLAELGYPPAVEAAEYTLAGLAAMVGRR